MGQKIATLEVELAMATGGAISDISRFGGVVDKVSAQAIKDLDRIDAAIQGVGDMSAAEAGMVRMAEATARSAVATARELNRVERAGESMLAQLDRQIATYGKTASEVRALKAEEAALAADRAGKAELAMRIREREQQLYDMEFASARRARAEVDALAEDKAAAAAAAERAAAQLLAEASAAERLSREHAQLAATVRASHDAQEADARAAERLRAATDPLYAATKRLNEEIAESTRLYHAGVTAPAEYARQQEVLAARLRNVGQASDDIVRKNGRISSSLTQLSFQGNDIITMYMAGASAGQIFATQAGQIVQVVQMAEGGFWGLARAVGGALVPFAPLIIAAGLVAGGLALLNKEMSEDSGLKEFANGLGLTHKEMKKLGDVSVTAMDMIKGLWTTISDTTGIDKFVAGAWSTIKEFTRNFWEVIVGLTGGFYTAFVGSYRGFVATWDKLPGAFADIFIRAVNAAIERLNILGSATNDFLGVEVFGQIDQLTNRYAGAAKDVSNAWTKAFRDTSSEWNNGVGSFMERWTKNSVAAAQERLTASAAAIIADRTETKAKADKEAEKAARELAQTYDQIISKLDPLTAATREYEETVRDIAKLLAAGLLGDGDLGQQYADQLAAAAREIEMKAKGQWVELKLPDIEVDTTGLDKAIPKIDRVGLGIRTIADDIADLREAAERLGFSLGDAFGRGGAALGSMTRILVEYGERQAKIDEDLKNKDKSLAQARKASADLQLDSMIGLTSAARGLFDEHSKGYKAMLAAEQALTVVQLARTAVDVAGGAARMFATLGPFAFPAVAAMLGVMASLGFSSGGSAGTAPETNSGTGTVFGDSSAESASIKRALDLLADLDTEALVVSRQMAASLKAIESNIGGLTNLVIRLGGTDGVGSDATQGVETGFQKDTLGKALESMFDPFGKLLGIKIPVISDILGGIGSIIGGLFGSKTTVVGQGIYGAPQTIGAIDAMGFDGQTFADIQKKKKFLGVTTSTKYSTQYGALDASLEDQFGKLLLSFADTIKLAAGPLGLSLGEVENKLNSFVVDIGKIDLKGLTGEEIQERLTAVFGQQADLMAQSVIDLQRYQKVGEGAFETLVRVASTVETVTTSLEQLGLSTKSLGIDASMAIADLFGGASEYASAADAYFSAFYTDIEQAAARSAQLGKVFNSLGITMPDSIAAYRALVEAQDLSTASGQQLYAQLLQLAPAFAEVVNAGQSATSAAAILRERNDLERQLLQLEGKTTEIRALELAQLDPSNRAIQERIYALQDEATAAQAASAAAQERAALERTILQLQGDTAALRAIELAALDPANRALQERVYALQDEAAAAAAAAQVASQRDGLLRQLYEVQGNTTKLRQMELDALDPSNRALQRQIWAFQDLKESASAAASKARELADAWGSVGDSILDEINRIRGIGGTAGASLDVMLQQFNAMNAAARAGDVDAARSLPELSKALLSAAEDQARSYSDYKAIEGIALGGLEQSYKATLNMVSAQEATAKAAERSVELAVAQQNWWKSFSEQQAVATANASAANDQMAAKLDALEARLGEIAEDQRNGHATIASNTGKAARILENVTLSTGGDSIAISEAA